MSEPQEDRGRYLEELKTFLRIPSVSTLAEFQHDIRRAAGFVTDRLRAAGLDGVELIEGKGNPVVYGHWLGANDKPTLLIYGHYDVQPAAPLDEWDSPPFEPTVRGDDIFARGASDDKGQLLILVNAVESLLAAHGTLPVNVRFLIEGEEEVGGEHVESIVAEKSDRTKADAVLIADTEMFAPELPTLCVGLRGIVYGELSVRSARQDLHSGVYGGVAPNPIQALAEMLTALKDTDGRIRIDGFYDRVQRPTPREQQAWARLPFDETKYRERELGALELVGELRYSPLERLWARPTLEVHGIRGGFTGEGAKTVIPATAVAKISMRLVPDQRPEEAVRQLEAAVHKICPTSVQVEWRPIHRSAPSLIDPENPFIQAAAKALEDRFGKPAVYIRSGGSIPIVGVFQEHLGIPSVLMGFGLPDDNIHAPNEKLHLPNFYRGIEATARYLELLGE